MGQAQAWGYIDSVRKKYPSQKLQVTPTFCFFIYHPPPQIGRQPRLSLVDLILAVPILKRWIFKGSLKHTISEKIADSQQQTKYIIFCGGGGGGFKQVNKMYLSMIRRFIKLTFETISSIDSVLIFNGANNRITSDYPKLLQSIQIIFRCIGHRPYLTWKVPSDENEGTYIDGSWSVPLLI